MRRREILIALAGFAAVTVVFFLPIVVHPNSSVVFEPNDLTSTARDYWAAATLGKSPFAFAHDTLFRAPLGRSVSPAVQIANAVQPLVVLALHPLTGYLGAMNAFALLGILASLMTMYWFLRSNDLQPAACAAASIAFASSPFTLEQLFYGHAAFTQMWVYPLLLGALSWATKGSHWRAAAPGAALALAFYTSSYLGLFASVAALLFALVYLTSSGDLRAGSRRIGVAAGTTGILLLPAIFASRLAPSSNLLLAPISKGNLTGARLPDFFLPSGHNFLLGSLVRSTYGTHEGEHVEFFGYAVLALAATAAVLFATKRRRTSLVSRFALLAVPIGWLLALPAYATIGHHSIPLPDAANILGGAVSWWRIYARFASLAGFGLCILAAIGLDHILRSRSRYVILAGCALIAVVALEALPGIPVQHTRLHEDFAVRWLRTHPGGIVAAYPIVTNGTRSLKAWDKAYWGFYYSQIYHRHPIFAPPQGEPDANVYDIGTYLAENLNSPLTTPILRAEGVRYVVVRPHLYREMGLPQPALRGLRRVASNGETTIYRVVAPAVDLTAFLQSHEPGLARGFAVGDPRLSFGRGFYGPEHYESWSAARWLSQDGEIKVRPAQNRGFIVYRLTLWGFAHQTARTLQIFQGKNLIGSVFVPPHEIRYQTALHLPGPSTLRLHVDPGPDRLSSSDAREGSLYLEAVAIEPFDLSLSNR